MKVAKASEEDLKRTHSFLQAMESMFDSRNRYSIRDEELEWKDWDEDDDDKKMILSIQKEVIKEYGYNEDSEITNKLTLLEFIKRKYKTCDLHWNRVYWAANVLIDNACDPNEDCLAWHPFIERAMESSMLGE